MAGGIDWFRWHHGSVNDQKFGLVAKKACASVAEVIAVWACLLEASSISEDRGNPGAIDFEAMDFALGLDDGKAAEIYSYMAERGLMTDDGRITAWDKRQPKREREDETAADRKRRQREREDAQNGVTGGVTPCHTMSHHVTPRGEESRGDKTTSNPNGLDAASDAVDPSAKPGKPDCPHQEIIALYHEVLPMCPQIRDWTPARATQLRARWNEDEKRQNLAYWKQFFEYVGQCDFLVGRAGKTPFFADLEWMTKSANFTKIREAKYENKRPA
jgi:hypothetical protein